MNNEILDAKLFNEKFGGLIYKGEVMGRQNGRITNKDKKITYFILRHIDLIDNYNFLNKVYDFCHSSYDFTVKYKVLDMPFKYVKKWCSEHTNYAMNLLRDKKNEFAEDQRKELLAAILG